MTPVSNVQNREFHTMASSRNVCVGAPVEIAGRFVRARLDRAALADFPGEIPETLDAAYAIQDAAIAQWPDTLRGWKVGRILEPWLSRFGDDRLVGPIFGREIQEARIGQEVRLPVFAGGFAAVEAEFVLRLAADVPPRKTSWTAQDAGALVDAMFAGVELAGSPLASINDLGPAVIISDFGNNAGLVLGPAFPSLAWGATRSVHDGNVHRRAVGRARHGGVGAGWALRRARIRARVLREAGVAAEGGAVRVNGCDDGRSHD